MPGFVSHVELIWEEPEIARFLRRLSSFARLIVFDKRGQGLSDRPGRPPTLEESMDDLRAVMDAAGSERAAVFGVSEGGPMSMLFAATHPDRITSLVLYGTWARMVRAPDYPSGDRPRDARPIGGGVRAGVGRAGRRQESGLRALPGDAEFRRSWARLLRQGTSPTGAIELLDLYREIDVRAGAPRDRGADPGHSTAATTASSASTQGRYLAEHIPGARFVELDGGDHLAWVGDQDSLLDEIEEFLIGSRRGREPERALATVLFTDIVGSTETAGASSATARWRDLLERHDAVVRRELAVASRPRGQDDRRRLPRHLRRPGAGDPLRDRDPRRARRARDSRSAPASTPARSS